MASVVLFLLASLVFYLHHSCRLKFFVNLPLLPFPHPVIFIWTAQSHSPLTIPASVYQCIYTTLAFIHLPQTLFSFFLPFLYPSFSFFSIGSPLLYPVIFFLPILSLVSPFFHLCPASTNERCHGLIDTGWSVCS